MEPLIPTLGTALRSAQTRRVPMPGGGTQALTYPMLTWIAFEYLVDRAYFTPERLAELANVDGWRRADTPFEERFAAVVVYWMNRCDRDYGDYDAYFCARI